MSIFTYSERTVKKHNADFIYKQVEAILAKRGIEKICVNKLPSDNTELFTTEKASEIIDSIVWDSVYHAT